MILMLFFFNDTATTEIYTLSLHDALPISGCSVELAGSIVRCSPGHIESGCILSYYAEEDKACADRKSTRLNSSHANISYAVFCLKKKNKSYPILLLLIHLNLPFLHSSRKS